MAALRHAARRLCGRALQGTPRASPVRRPLSTTSYIYINGQPKTTAGPHDELRMEFEEKREELFELCMEMRRTGAFKTMSWEDLQNLRLTTHLAAQVKPQPDHPMWRTYRRYRSIYDFQSAYYCLGFLGYVFFVSRNRIAKEKRREEERNKANVLSDIEPKNE